MSDEASFVGVVGLIAIIAAGFGSAAITRSEWQTKTIERGLAQYCPDTGEWAWKGECDHE